MELINDNFSSRVFRLLTVSQLRRDLAFRIVADLGRAVKDSGVAISTCVACMRDHMIAIK